MGCGSSTQKNDAFEQINASKQQKEAEKIGNVTTVNSDCNEALTMKKANNLERESNNRREDSLDTVSPGGSLEILVAKKEKSKNSVGKRNATKSQRKELKQVVAWGKKTSKTEANFLEDLRTQRRESNPFYEQDYELNEVDETARFIDQTEQEESSLSELSNSHESSHQMATIYHEVCGFERRLNYPLKC